MSSCRVYLRYFALFFISFLNEDQFVMSKWLDYGHNSESYRYCEASNTIVQDSGEFNFYDVLRQYQDFCLYIKPTGVSSVTVRFTDFELGYQDENGNCTDYLEIGSRDVYSSSRTTRYCGYESPPPFTSHTGSVWILVHRQTLFNQLRQSIRIEYSSELTCNGEIKMDSYTFVSSPKFYGLMGNCHWTVILKDPSERVKHQPLQVQLTNWTVNRQMRTFRGGGASVTIYDGKGGSILQSFDQNNSPSDVTDIVITTTGPEVYIIFSSNLYPNSAFFNATVKVKGYCVPGTLRCGDGETCYSEKQVCDGELQCSTGYDELGCSPCSSMEFWCGKEDKGQCYTISERCNGFRDCQGSVQDEKNCNSCGPGSFLCKADSQCIYERWRCDGDFDCGDNSDEEGCPYGATRRVITAAVIGSLVCALLLVIAIGCTCKLYSLRASHHRHQQQHYRTTPLTRVERELFARQAPPTYDMTVSGVNTENATTRSQRNRRRRSRRYQFQRAAPADVGQQSNNDSRQEGVQSTNSGSTRSASGPIPTPTSGGHTPANATLTTQRQSSSGDQSNPNPSTDILRQFRTFLFESINSGSGTPTDESVPATQRTSTPVPTTTRGSGTQTNPTNRSEQNQSSSSANQRTSSSSRRSNRSSSRNRSQRGGSSSSKEQQAKPLPKKKRILPVMVSAPCADVAVEEDMLACVYPCPPSYSQAVASGSPQNYNESTESRDDDVEESSASVENSEGDTQRQPQPETPEPEFSPGDDSLTTVTRSRFLPFSIGQAIRNIASASFSRLQRNPYLQMSSQGSRRNSVQDHTSTDSATGNSFPASTQQRPSISSDEDIVDCAIDNQSLRRDSADVLLPLHPVASVTETPTASSTTRKIFPKRKNLDFFTKRNTSGGDTDSLDMSDLTSFEER